MIRGIGPNFTRSLSNIRRAGSRVVSGTVQDWQNTNFHPQSEMILLTQALK